MERLKLGRSGMLVSPVILGAWAFGSQQWGDQPDDSVHIGVVRAALDHGINMIDTAHAYGRSEEIVGKAIKGRRDEVLIATKCSGPPEAMREQAEMSLARLGIDCIDLCFIHGPHAATPIAESVGTIDEMRREGKLRHIGVSNFSIRHHKEALATARIDATQPCYGVLWRAIEHDGLRQWCVENEVAITPFSPLAQGLLTGKYNAGAALPTDYRSRNLLFQPGRFERCLEICDKLAEIGGQYGKSVAQVAINWTAYAPWGVSFPMVGARSPDQVADNAGGVGWRLNDDDWRDISRAGEQALDRIDYSLNIWGDSATWGAEP